jgi:hypothetical protein
VHDLQDDSIEAGIVSGKIKLHLVGKGDSAALMAFEIIGKEFVIVALKNFKTKNDIDLSDAAENEAMRLGKIAGCSYLRFHTFRPALVKIALSRNYLPPEFVLRKKLS